LVPLTFSHPPWALVLVGIVQERATLLFALRASVNLSPVNTEMTVSVYVVAVPFTLLR
jgi:hypothetical protein